MSETAAKSTTSKQNWTSLLAFKDFICLTCCCWVTSWTTFWGCGKRGKWVASTQRLCNCSRHLGDAGHTFPNYSMVSITVQKLLHTHFLGLPRGRRSPTGSTFWERTDEWLKGGFRLLQSCHADHKLKLRPYVFSF